jgi:hypothetical protein
MPGSQPRVASCVVLDGLELVEQERRVPEGLVQAILLGRLSTEGFESLLSRVVGTGLVRRTAGELVWAGS